MQEKQLLLKQQNVWKAFTSAPRSFDRKLEGEYAIAEGKPLPKQYLNEPRETSLYYDSLKKFLPFEALTSEVLWNGKYYQITILVSVT